jgi:predicted lipoprotein with Yx(FWY)xxD motif
MPLRTLMAALTMALIGAGCGGMDEPAVPAATTSPAPTAPATTTAPAVSATAPAETAPAEPVPPKHPTLKVVKSDFGRTIADDHGEALYLFDADTTPKSTCYGECAAAWPPLLVKRAPTVAGALDPALVSTTKRKDGTRQVTYNGHPLYYYVGDSAGVIRCQNVYEYGGRWLVVKPNGRANLAT